MKVTISASSCRGTHISSFSHNILPSSPRRTICLIFLTKHNKSADIQFHIVNKLTSTFLTEKDLVRYWTDLFKFSLDASYTYTSYKYNVVLNCNIVKNSG